MSKQKNHGGSNGHFGNMHWPDPNDPVVITSGLQDGAVTEITDGTHGENRRTLSTSGAISFTDSDSHDSHTISITPNGTGYIGTLTAAIRNEDDHSHGHGHHGGHSFLHRHDDDRGRHGDHGHDHDSSDGSVYWTFWVNDSALDYLAAGETLIQTYTMTIDDGHGGAATQLVTITLHGTNDAPVITSAVKMGSVTELPDGSAGENTAVLTSNGTINFTDVDLSDGHVVTATPVHTGYRGTLVATLADPATGDGSGAIDWTYSVNDAALDDLNAGDQVIEKFVITIDDGHGGLATKAITIKLNGADDATGSVNHDPVITSGAQAGLVFEITDGASGENLTTHTQSGAITFSDQDSADVHTATVDPVPSSYLGDFVLAPVNDSTGTVAWSFSVNDSDLDNLTEGQVITQTYDVTIDDGAGGTVIEPVTITITGANDVPVVGGVTTGDVTENSNPTVLTTAGELTINDADDGQSSFDPQAATPGSSGLGTFTLDGEGRWTYSADNTQAAIQQLGVGNSLTDSFVAVSSDGTASESVTVTIHGVNHAPTAISLDNTTVNENAAGAVIGAVSVADQDSGETFTYQVDDDRFEIANGNLKLKDGVALDFEQEPNVHIAISATDSGGLSVGHLYSIVVNDGAEGNAIDGYIAGATVYADANNNGMLDAGEVSATTDADGNFTLFDGSGPLVMEGGTDISTGLAFTGVMRAPEGSTVVTPLTTLVAAIAGPGATSQDIADANAIVLQGLGLDSSIDLASFDPIKATVSSDPTQQTQGQAAVAAAVQIQNTIVQASSLLSGAGATDATTAFVTELANQISTQVQNSQTLDLNDANVLTSVITAAGTAAGANSTSLAATASGAANVISASNQVISDATGQAGVDLLTTLAQVSLVAQGSASTSLADAGAGTVTISDVETNYTGTNLTTQVDNATVGDVLGANAPVNLIGTNGNDVLHGNAGDDTLQGLGGNDFLQGLGGDDTLDGGAGFDRAVYTDATGSLTVGLAAGTVSGAGVGSDTLLAIKSVQGGNSADSFDATGFSGGSTNAGSNGTFNEFEGMGGDDTITGNGNTRVSYLHAGAGVTVDVAAGTGTGDASVGSDTFTGIGSVRGSNYDDTIHGSNNGFEQFEGRGGSDLIDGLGGLDRVRYEFESSAIQVDLAAGTVTGGDAGGGQDTLQSVELVRGTNFDDTYDATGFGGGSTNAGSNGTYNEFEGMGGNDTITGNGNTSLVYYNATAGVTVDLAAGTVAGDASVGNDTITGGVTQLTGSQFDDTLQGFDNPFGVANIFDGRGGNDTFDGRGGFDKAVYDNTPTSTGIAVDMAAGTVTGDSAIGTDTLISIESVRGTYLADTFDATGYNGASADLPLGTDFNEFEGMGGDDVITGNGNTRISYLSAGAGVTVDVAAGTASGAATGNDTFTGVSRVRGSNLDDTISGDGNDNVIEGRNGNDVLDGRGGNDTLTGGANADTFVYATGGGADTIADFNQGDGDKIDLTGVNGVTDFVGVLALAAQNGADTVIDFGGGDTLTLTGITLGNLTAGDFIVGAPPNQAPTDISLSNASVAENSANGTVVGSLSAVDPDAGDSASFALLDDAGGQFALNGNDVVVAGALDYETATSHDITVRVTDGGGLTYDKTFSIGVSNVNEAPTDIALSNASVAENSANGTVVGSLSAVDPDAGDSASFALLDDAGGQFALNGNDVVVAGALDYETATSHDITVRVTDGGGLTYDKTFSIGVSNVNEAPTDIALSNASVAENSANGTVVGSLSALDPDAGDSASFTLLDDAGGLFALSGSDVVVAGALDYETATSHDITMRVTDGGGLTYDKILTIDVTDVAGLNIVGDAGDNILSGSPENDTLQGLGGNDFLQGLGGDDTLDGGAGFDRAVYTDATGSLTVGLAAGTVSGAGVGSDTLLAIELVQGGNSADSFDATGFSGGSTNAGSNGTFNEFEGMGGDDTITGNGNTRVSYLHAGAGVTVDVAAGTGTGDASVGSDTFTGIGSVRGSNYDDTIHGSNNGFEQFEGRGGSDLIDGLGGLDRVRYEFEFFCHPGRSCSRHGDRRGCRWWPGYLAVGRVGAWHQLRRHL